VLHGLPELPLTALVGLTPDPARLLVLTVNNRHARRLLADWSTQGLNDNTRAVRQVPHIVPLSAWLRQAAEALTFSLLDDAPPMAAHVLDAFGAQELWTRVIEQEEPQRPLLDVRAAARLAMEADRLIVDWQLRIPDGAQSVESARFAQWRQAYLGELRRLDAQDDVRVTEAVLHAAARDALPLPFDAVALSGFTELAPVLQTLLAHWQRQGLHVARLASSTPSAAVALRTSAATHEAQWRDAAAWAARQLRRHPQGRFAIVAASLQADVAFAHRALREALAELPYNVAVARPLSEWPLARAALAWLRVLSACQGRPGQTAQPGCAPAVAGAALLAGACAAQAQEASARAAIDALWRRQGALSVSRTALAQLLHRRAPILAQAWQTALAQVVQDGARATLDVWSARFRRDLQTLGFPGDAGQDSAAHQTLQALEAAFDRATAQAFAFGMLRRPQALSVLDRLLRQTRFQPMRDPAARLDVLGLLEAEGGRWDAVWVLGLHDTVLPAAPRPNPLLPLADLREAGAPRVTLARELQWAQAMRDALLRCAPRVLFSHARQQGEETLRASPVLLGLPEIAAAQAVDGDWDAAAHDAGEVSPQEVPPSAHQTTPRTDVCLETLLDAQGPPLAAGKPLRGGIDVIDTQARHPLWAFVKYRLGASQLRDYAQSAQPNTRGNFLHHGMELIWRLLPDQQALQQCWEQDRLPALVAQAVAQAADKHLQDVGTTLKRLEMQRAEQILLDCLALERTRAPFRIQTLEQTVHWREASLELRVRMDRVDELADGGLAVIDYKTGASQIAVRHDWMRARPVNLQLPFYAAMLPHAPHQVVALMLVRLHARQVELRGLARDADMKGVATPEDWSEFFTWDGVMQHWRAAIQTIAREVADGVAENVVRHRPDLQYCDALPFLRLNETVTPGDAHVG